MGGVPTQKDTVDRERERSIRWEKEVRTIDVLNTIDTYWDSKGTRRLARAIVGWSDSLSVSVMA
jgi:hypothetical protein